MSLGEATSFSSPSAPVTTLASAAVAVERRPRPIDEFTPGVVVSQPRTGGWRLALGALCAFAALGAVETAVEPAVKGGAIVPGDVAWMLTAAALVLLMTPGLAFFYGGMVSRKNVVSMMLQSVAAMGLISLIWVAFGFSLAFGDSLGGVIGDPRTFFMLRGVGGATHPDLAPTIPLALFALFQLKFAIITPALITGAFAERMRFSSYLLFTALFSIFIY